MRVSGFSRFVARRVLGAEGIEDGSWAEARHPLERAVLEPTDPLHKEESADLLRRLQ